MTIDCSEIIKASSDSALLSAIARQTGYWPVFPFVNALNNMIDIASMGLMGQKGLLHDIFSKANLICFVTVSWTEHLHRGPSATDA